MASFNRKKMCNECPFRQKSIRGWLGPHTVDQLDRAVHSEEVFICHVDIAKLGDKGLTPDEIEEKGQHCVGILRYRNSVFKNSRDPEISQAQKALKTVKDQPVIPARGFKDHHDIKRGRNEDK